MEWCEVLYEERRPTEYLYRIARTVFVFLVTFSAVMWMWSQSAESRCVGRAVGKDDDRAEAGKKAAEKDTVSGLLDGASAVPLSMILLPEMDPELFGPVREKISDTADNGSVPGLTPGAAAGMAPVTGTASYPGTTVTPDTAMSISPDAAVSVSPDTETVLSPGTETVILPDTEMSVSPDTGVPPKPETDMPDAGAGAPSDITADLPKEETLPELPAEPGDAAGDTADPSEPEVPGDEAVPEVTGGFLVDDSGIIYGISDPSAAILDGIMELPSERCTGIASGAFAQVGCEVREIYIPANIRSIEAGAFSGLTYMEWFEAEPGGPFCTSEGILYSENGTCLFAFPEGRTGMFKMPSHVERIAAGAFSGANITGLDISSCTLPDPVDLPGHISVIR